MFCKLKIGLLHPGNGPYGIIERVFLLCSINSSLSLQFFCSPGMTGAVVSKRESVSLGNRLVDILPLSIITLILRKQTLEFEKFASTLMLGSHVLTWPMRGMEFPHTLCPC